MSSMQTWYHIARTPNGFYVHRLNPIEVLDRAGQLRQEDPELSEPEAIAEVHGEIAEQIRTALGFPVKGRWFNREGWDSSLSVGEPHPTMMEKKLNDDIDILPGP